jgi:hypothetical protein
MSHNTQLGQRKRNAPKATTSNSPPTFNLLSASTGHAQQAEATLKKFLQQYLGPPTHDSEARYLSAFVDLNGDGKQEAIVYLLGNDFCGSGGCSVLVLTPQDSSYNVVTETTISRPPIRILATKTNGWSDLSVSVSGGGIKNAYDAKLSFNGKKYPSNPTIPPALKLKGKLAGSIIIPSINDAKPLFP